MFGLFKPKQFRVVHKLLQTNSFFTKDYACFKIDEIAHELIQLRKLSVLVDVIKATKMDHIRLLKGVLLVLRILQMAPQMQESRQMEAALQLLQAKATSIVRYSRTKTAKVSNFSVDFSAKALNNSLDNQQEIYSCEATHLVGKVIMPLLALNERVIYCYDMAYRPKQHCKFQLCWATLNLLRRFTDFGKALEQMVRYYGNDYLLPMICTIKVLHHDIKILYKRAKDYIGKEINTLFSLLEGNQDKKISKQLQFEINQVLLLIETIERINEQMRSIYCGKYYMNHLIANHVICPYLLDGGPEAQCFYRVTKGQKKWASATSISSSKKTRDDIEQVEEV